LLFEIEQKADLIAQMTNNIRKTLSASVRSGFDTNYVFIREAANKGDLKSQAVYQVISEFYGRYFGPKAVPMKQQYASRYYKPRRTNMVFNTSRIVTPSEPCGDVTRIGGN
jgi:hypothetical protein